ncbi:MAG: hypothetical protein IKA23_01215 [Akkermansia sp.]|nr:hypothetical protein [Akkermansia sp.]MBR2314832.1 hypothetical protein [Akkermansia sp.]
MNTLPPDFDATRATPAALPAGLQNKLLAAMQQAADEEHEFRKVEQVLHRMRPAELSSRLVGRLGVQMYLTAQQKRHSGHWRAWLRGGAAAAALALCVGSGALLLPGSAVAEGNDQGLVGRNVIDSRSTGKVVWRRGEAPVRHYQVIYEDSFVLEEDDTTTVIRVPNTTEVEVEEDYL